MALIFVQPPLPSAPAGADFAWAGWSNDGKRLRKQGIAPPALLPEQGDVIVVLPAAALSWQQVTLPQGSTAGSAGPAAQRAWTLAGDGAADASHSAPERVTWSAYRSSQMPSLMPDRSTGMGGSIAVFPRNRDVTAWSAVTFLAGEGLRGAPEGPPGQSRSGSCSCRSSPAPNSTIRFA